MFCEWIVEGNFKLVLQNLFDFRSSAPEECSIVHHFLLMSLGQSHFHDASLPLPQLGLTSAFLSISLMTGTITMNTQILSKEKTVSW